MTEPKARQIILAARPQGKPQRADFRLEETAIPTPSAGQVLLRVQYLSLDPYMRGRMDDRKSYAKPVPLGGVMQGESVATVIASRHPGYSEGDIVLAQTGWRTHALSDRADLRKLDPAVAPVTTGLGVLGMPGFTAYAGLRVIGKPVPGETVVVAAASGPVGSLVGQLAKIAGARAVGIAGGPEKCAYAVRSFARTWTTDLKDRRIRVNAVSPGATDTPGLSDLLTSTEAGQERLKMIFNTVPLGRLGTPDEIAKAVVFLASDDSSYITGTELFVDGGFAQV